MPQTQINHADIRTRFIFDDMPVRGLHVRLENVWTHIVGQKHYPAAICRALGELLAAGALLSGNLKTDGTLIVQVQGQGRLKMRVVNDDESLTDLLGSNSVFVLTLQPKDAEPWQGVVPLEGGSIAQMLINYTKRSEQLDTQIVLASSDDACGGLLVQRLPETEPDAASWEHVSTLVQTLTPEELTGLDAQHVLYRLFHETPPRVFDPENIEFACTCSRGKVSDMLLMLGGEEVGGVVAEQGSIQIDCDFCHAKYVFDETDVNALFGADVVNAVLDEAKRLQ